MIECIIFFVIHSSMKEGANIRANHGPVLKYRPGNTGLPGKIGRHV